MKRLQVTQNNHRHKKWKTQLPLLRNLLISLPLSFVKDILLIFLHNLLLIQLTPLYLIPLFHTKTLLQTKSFEVLHQKSLCITFLTPMLIISTTTLEPILSLSIIFLLSIKSQDLMLLIEGLNLMVRMRLWHIILMISLLIQYHRFNIW